MNTTSETITIPAIFKYWYIIPKKFISPNSINKNSIITISITNNNEITKTDNYFDDDKNPITRKWNSQDFLAKLSK